MPSQVHQLAAAAGSRVRPRRAPPASPPARPAAPARCARAASSAMPQRSNSCSSATAAGPGGIADACAPPARALAQRVLAADVGPRRAGAHRDRHAGMHQVGPAAGHAARPRPRACRWRRRPAPPGRRPRRPATRLAASTPPTDSMASSAPLRCRQASARSASRARVAIDEMPVRRGACMVDRLAKLHDYVQPELCRQSQFGTSSYRKTAWLPRRGSVANQLAHGQPAQRGAAAKGPRARRRAPAAAGRSAARPACVPASHSST